MRKILFTALSIILIAVSIAGCSTSSTASNPEVAATQQPNGKGSEQQGQPPTGRPQVEGQQGQPPTGQPQGDGQQGQPPTGQPQQDQNSSSDNSSSSN